MDSFEEISIFKSMFQRFAQGDIFGYLYMIMFPLLLFFIYLSTIFFTSVLVNWFISLVLKFLLRLWEIGIYDCQVHQGQAHFLLRNSKFFLLNKDCEYFTEKNKFQSRSSHQVKLGPDLDPTLKVHPNFFLLFNTLLQDSLLLEGVWIWKFRQEPDFLWNMDLDLSKTTKFGSTILNQLIIGQCYFMEKFK